MDITRRQLIKGLGGLACFPIMANGWSQAPIREQLYISGTTLSNSGKKTDAFMVSAFDSNGLERFSLELPARGHGFAVSPDGRQCAIFARRPGKYILVLDPQNGLIITTINAPENRIFYGHGTYSPNGRYLFATEKNVTTGDGVITVRDCFNDFQKVHEYGNIGIGPHEMTFMPDGKTAVIAVGGIQTRGRQKINIETMRSLLVYLDVSTGQVLDSFSLSDQHQQLSIRHLDVNQNGQVAAVMQYQRKDRDMPLVLFHNGESVIEPIIAPPPIAKQMKNYCGSVQFDKSGKYIAVTSPRGNIVTIWQNGSFITHFEIPDGCGVSATEKNNTFMITSGLGGGFTYNVSTNTVIEQDSMFLMSRIWDNHLYGFSL